jgi:NAD(P)-dependent dehydrogenase (short-subunit alcohol dehydrogenase family)
MKKKIIISGGSGNLGRFLIQKFSEIDYLIFNLSRKKPKKLFKNEVYFECELSNFENTVNNLNKIKKNKIDLIISSAGNSKKNYKSIITDSNFITTFKDNFVSFSNLLEGYQKVFINKKIKIIAISSIAGLSLVDAPINYAVSKSALNHYCKIKAKQLAKFKININTICPGNIFINGNNWSEKMNANSSNVKKFIKKNVPLNTFCSPNSVFDLCLYLLGESGNNITGSNFIIDGGQSL